MAFTSTGCFSFCCIIKLSEYIGDSPFLISSEAFSERMVILFGLVMLRSVSKSLAIISLDESGNG